METKTPVAYSSPKEEEFVVHEDGTISYTSPQDEKIEYDDTEKTDLNSNETKITN